MARSIRFLKGSSLLNEYPIKWLNHGGEICVDISNGHGISGRGLEGCAMLDRKMLTKDFHVYGKKDINGGFLPFLAPLLGTIGSLIPNIFKTITGNGIHGRGNEGFIEGSPLDADEFTIQLVENGIPMYETNVATHPQAHQLIGNGFFDKLFTPIKEFLNKKINDRIDYRVDQRVKDFHPVGQILDKMNRPIDGTGIFGSGTELNGGFIQALLPFIPALASLLPTVIDLFKGQGIHGSAIYSGLGENGIPVKSFSRVSRYNQFPIGYESHKQVNGSAIPIKGFSKINGILGSGLEQYPKLSNTLYSEY